MKTLALIPISLLFIIHPIQAQTDSALTRDIYRAWIIPVKKASARPWSPPTERSQVNQGVLYEIKDSSVIIVNSFIEEDYQKDNFDVTKVDARSIDVIKIRKKGNAGMGILIGAISGIAVAGALDLIIYSNWKKVEGANSLEEGLNYIFVQTPQFIPVIASSIGLLGAGIGIGAAAGSTSIKIPIKGSQKLFDKNRSRLNDYSIKYNPGLGGKTFSKLRDTIVDIDGNVYHTLALGGQVWMAENLRVKRFREGSEISNIPDDTSGAGFLYNWFAVNDSIKPLSGWVACSFLYRMDIVFQFPGRVRWCRPEVGGRLFCNRQGMPMVVIDRDGYPSGSKPVSE